MWLLNIKTGARGWHICQIFQREPYPLLVFTPQGNDKSWKMEIWKNPDVKIIPENYAEELKDEKAMEAFPIRGTILA
jgi:hypothetical protein